MARVKIENPDDDEIARVHALLRKVGGPNVIWGASNTLQVWLAETQLEAERLAARRILVATWVLAIATIGLVAATIGLIVVTVGE